MKLEKISLTNFRNYKKKEFEFVDGINLITGANGTGKTNLLEALLFASTTASHRTSNKRILIKNGEESGRVKAFLCGEEGRFNLEIITSVSGGTSAKINSNRVKNGEILSSFPAVIFSPEDIEVIKGSRSGIRRMVNINICQISPGYIDLLIKYGKVLRERNALLKGNAGGGSLAVWTTLLRESSGEIDRARQIFIDKINESALELSPVFGLSETVSINYRLSGYTENAGLRDEESGFTTWGAHRAGFYFQLGGRDLKDEGSRGEARISALIYRFAFRQMLEAETGKAPIILMDDVFSELDSVKRRLIAEKLREGQVIFTATEKPEELEEADNVIAL